MKPACRPGKYHFGPQRPGAVAGKGCGRKGRTAWAHIVSGVDVGGAERPPGKLRFIESDPAVALERTVIGLQFGFLGGVWFRTLAVPHCR